MDDPSKLDRLALANLRENKHARNNLASLHAARSCLYGCRGLGDKKLFTDKPGIASRLKTQSERRQFHLGLVANVAFYNRLNLADLTSWLAAGTSLDVAAVRPDTMLSLTQFRELVQRLSPLYLLCWLTPDKAATLSDAVSDISAQVDSRYVITYRRQKPSSKGTVFFLFPGNSLGVTHSLEFEKLFFLSGHSGKKTRRFWNFWLFFFSQE